MSQFATLHFDVAVKVDLVRFCATFGIELPHAGGQLQDYFAEEYVAEVLLNGLNHLSGDDSDVEVTLRGMDLPGAPR